MPGPGSVPFDRAVDYYDRTRALPPLTATAQTELLAAQLRPLHGRCLEIGVGTGRIGLPLAAAGCRLVGVDLSGPMLERLRAKDPAGALPVARADATALPFRDASFAAAIACHVLHLVGDWVSAVDELTRVVRPDGVLLVTRGAARDPLEAEIRARIRAEAGLPDDARGLDRLDDLDAYLAALGAQVDHLPQLATGHTRSVAEYLQVTAEGIYSWIWDITPQRRRAAVESARAWVTAQHGDPATLTVAAPPIRWHRYLLGPGSRRARA